MGMCRWKSAKKEINLTNCSSDAMDELGLKRYCCRRMIMTHVDLIEKLLKYDSSMRLFHYLTSQTANTSFTDIPPTAEARLSRDSTNWHKILGHNDAHLQALMGRRFSR